MAIQLIINREWGLSKNENPNQGSFIVEELTEEARARALDQVPAHAPTSDLTILIPDVPLTLD
jgi:methylmalonyl-CoA mutase